MKKTLNNIFNICFLVAAMMSFAAAFSRVAVQSLLSAVLTIPCLALFLYVCIKKNKLIEKINYENAWWILRSISFVMMAIAAFSLEVDLSWDWGTLINSAYNYLKTGEISRAYYYARYPNNQFWLLCIVWLFKAIGRLIGDADILVFKRITMALSVIITQIAIEFIYRSAKVVFSAKKAFFAGIISLLCVPLYLYSQFFYTDIPSILSVSIMMFLYLKLQKSENAKARILFCVLLGIVGAFSYFIKITSFIVFVAILIGMFFSKINFKQFICFFLVSVTALSATVLAVKKTTEPIYENKFGLTEELKEENEFPPTHWIMMGLGYGGFSQDDVDFTASFETYDERKEATINEAEKRFKDYGLKGFLKHTFYDKVIRTYGSPTLAGSDYAGRMPLYPNNILSRLFTDQGDLVSIGLFPCRIYYVFMMLGVLFSAIEAVKKKKSESNQMLLAGRIAIFGISIFMLIWECNSRYLLVFTPVLILLCADGLSFFTNIFKRTKNK